MKMKNSYLLFVDILNCLFASISGVDPISIYSYTHNKIMTRALHIIVSEIDNAQTQ